MIGSLDNLEAWDKDGKKLTPKEFIDGGVSRGWTQDGQAVLEIRMNGQVRMWTMLAITKEDFIKVMAQIAEKTYGGKNERAN
jgi:hypothetical protein